MGKEAKTKKNIRCRARLYRSNEIQFKNSKNGITSDQFLCSIFLQWINDFTFLVPMLRQILILRIYLLQIYDYLESCWREQQPWNQLTCSPKSYNCKILLSFPPSFAQSSRNSNRVLRITSFSLHRTYRCASQAHLIAFPSSFHNFLAQCIFLCYFFLLNKNAILLKMPLFLSIRKFTISINWKMAIMFWPPESKWVFECYLRMLLIYSLQFCFPIFLSNNNIEWSRTKNTLLNKFRRWNLHEHVFNQSQK